MVKKLFILLLIVVFYVFPKQIYAQQCINGGVTCCVEGTGPNGDYDDCAYSYPGSCSSSCGGECSDGGAPQDDGCYIGADTPGGGGVGGFCDWSVTNCPSGWTRGGNVVSVACGSICPGVGSAQAVTGCCGSGFTDENGDFVCGNQEVTTYNCCASGTNWGCTTVDSGTTYEWLTYLDPTACQEAGEVYVSHTTSDVEYRTYRDCPEDRPACNNWITEYYTLTTCTDLVTTCSCQPTCDVVAPTAPTLLSPSNGGFVTTNTVSLIWDNIGQVWGDSCVPDSNEFEVYIGTNPASLALIGTVGTGTGSASFEGNTGVTYYWKVRAKNGSANTDSSVWSFTINEGPWWQVKDGDVTTNGILSSSVPDLDVFSDIGSGGSHGVPVYGTSFNLYLDTPERISLNIWNANTTTTQSRIFNYSYFSNLIPEDIQFNNISEIETGGILTDINGYEWYKVTGDYNTSGDINIGNRRVVLFVEQGNLNIAGKINLNDGIGFFGAFVDGNITIDQAVNGAPAIEGVYMADNNVSTGEGDTQLHLRGSIASYGAVSLQRDLVDNSQPAELFEFAPDQMMLFPKQLQFKRAKWAEVAP